MKKLIPFLALILIPCFHADLVAAPRSIGVCASQLPPMSLRDLHKLLKIAADHWNWSLAHTRQKYLIGELSITPYPAGGANVYMIEYDGFCILAALEDKL